MYKIFAVIFTLMLMSCGTSENNKNKEFSTNIISQSELQKASSTLIKSFMKDLKSELMKGIKEGGYSNAISSCQLKAPEIANNISNKHWTIKRVTDKPRNPQNKTNRHEQQVLKLFSDTLNKLEFFDEYLNPENKTDFYFYKPIYVGKFCLNCHGNAEMIDKKTSAAIQEKYPSDQALNYIAGDLRGMFVVHIKNPQDTSLIREKEQDSLKF